MKNFFRFSVIFTVVFCMMFSFTSCSKGKEDQSHINTTADTSKSRNLSYTVRHKLSEDDESETTFTVEETDGEKDGGQGNYQIKISDANGFSQTIQTVGSEPHFKNENLISFDDLNFDGYADLQVVVYLPAKNPQINVWLYDKAEKQFILAVDTTNDENSGFAGGLTLYPKQKYFVLNTSDAAVAYTDTVYRFDNNNQLVKLRVVSYGINDNEKRYIKAIDYSHGGSFIMFNRTLSSGEDEEVVREKLLFVGLDGDTLTEREAEEAVHRVAGSKASGVSAECEGIEALENTVYYLVRVDKSHTTSAYYYVDSVSGTVRLKQGGSGLI